LLEWSDGRRAGALALGEFDRVDGADAEHADRHFGGAAKLAEVFAAISGSMVTTCAAPSQSVIVPRTRRVSAGSLKEAGVIRLRGSR